MKRNRIVGGLIALAACLGFAEPAQATDIDPLSTAEWSMTKVGSASDNDAQACYTFQKYKDGVIGSVSGNSITPTSADGSPSAGAWVRYITNSRNDPNSVRTIYLRPSEANAGPDNGGTHTAYCELWYRSLNVFGVSDFYNGGTYAVVYWMNSSPAAIPVQWYRTQQPGPCWTNTNPIQWWAC